LLDLALEASKSSDTLLSGAFDQKACFAGVKYNGKGNWNPPTQRQVSGLWDLKETPNGILEFHFTIDPPAYKLEMQRIQKLANAAEAAGKPLKKSLLEPISKEIISTTTMSKPDAPQTQFDRLMTILINNYREDKTSDNEEIIRDLK